MEQEANVPLSLDGNAQSFYSYLEDLHNDAENRFTVEVANQLRQVTIMDQSIKQYVIRHRNMVVPMNPRAND